MRISDLSSDVCSSDLAEVALLLDRGRLGVTLGDDDPAQVGAMHAGHALPGRFPEMVAEMDPSALLGGIEEEDRKSVVSGKRESVRVDRGGCSVIKKKLKPMNNKTRNYIRAH